MSERVPVTRHDADGSTVDGTAEMDRRIAPAALTGGRGPAALVGLRDFRDLDGRPMALDVPGSVWTLPRPSGGTVRTAPAPKIPEAWRPGPLQPERQHDRPTRDHGRIDTEASSAPLRRFLAAVRRLGRS